MKFILKIIIVSLLLGSASDLLAQKEIFIKQIEFRLDAVSDIDYENEYFVTLKLNKGSKYVFRIVNHIDEYVGEAVVELMDADNLILTNLFQDKYFLNTSFVCNKTGFYDLLVRFRDNKLGNSVIDILLIQ